MDRTALEQEWLRLTRDTMPALAAERRWPVRFDHCFQRILLDNAVGGVWYDAISKRPAYAHAPDDVLSDAITLGRRAIAEDALLPALNASSLHWRKARKRQGELQLEG